MRKPSPAVCGRGRPKILLRSVCWRTREKRAMPANEPAQPTSPDRRIRRLRLDAPGGGTTRGERSLCGLTREFTDRLSPPRHRGVARAEAEGGGGPSRTADVTECRGVA